ANSNTMPAMTNPRGARSGEGCQGGGGCRKAIDGNNFSIISLSSGVPRSAKARSVFWRSCSLRYRDQARRPNQVNSPNQKMNPSHGNGLAYGLYMMSGLSICAAPNERLHTLQMP